MAAGEYRSSLYSFSRKLSCPSIRNSSTNKSLRSSNSWTVQQPSQSKKDKHKNLSKEKISLKYAELRNKYAKMIPKVKIKREVAKPSYKGMFAQASKQNCKKTSSRNMHKTQYFKTVEKVKHKNDNFGEYDTEQQGLHLKESDYFKI